MITLVNPLVPRFVVPLARVLLILIAAVAAPAAVAAHPDGPGGGDTVAPVSFSLMHPAPRGAMRPLNTDRPDRTESPYTLDGGHLQIEMDALAYRRDQTPGEKVEEWGMAITNLKLGLLHGADLQMILETRLRERIEIELPSGPHVYGGTRFGNALVRLKVNAWGNDAGRTALAIMPFASLRSSASADFGVIVPFAAELPHGVGFGTMAQAEWEYARDYQSRWIGSATASHAIAGSLGGFVELWGARSYVRNESDVATFDAGLTCAVGDDVRFDTGVNVGLNEAAQDLTLFLGVSLRR